MAGEAGTIVSVQIGSIAPLGRRRVPSAFVKQPVSGAVMAGELGLAGDHQADLRVHGGPDKAVYCYPSEHYEKWRTMAPSAAPLLVQGGFGENLTTQGLDEDHVYIGDIYRMGGATVQVTQPRQPCFKLALRFDDKQMVREMVRSGMSGWYLRVLEPGPVEAGASIRLIERPNPQWSIARFNGVTGRGPTTAEMAELANLPGLARDVQSAARAALAKLQ